MAERRVSHRSSTSSSSRSSRANSTRLSNPNIFSDEYALDSLHISDGIQPPRHDNLVHESTAQEAQHPVSPVSPVGFPEARYSEDDYHAPSSIRRNSGSRKSAYNQQRLSNLSRPDNTRHFPPPGTRASILFNETPTSAFFRSASRASTFTISRTQSPYQGATGPSHQYGMDSQDIGVLRNPSTTTSSTIRPRERSYTGPSGPTQPYGMYPQNTVPEDDIDSMQSLHPPVPVGFPGRPQDYRRRLGPDAEDADDLIGPDGYTEQLPPYTRYPDGIPPKGDNPGPASILSAQREDQGTSEETSANPFQFQGSLRQHNDGDHSSTELTAVARSESPQEDEGGNFKERVKEKSKKRMCFGVIPLWIIAILVILMVAVLAGVVGAVVGHARGEQQAASTPQPNQPPPLPAAQSTTVIVTTTSLVDATPLPSTPTNLPSLPTGTFYVPLGNPTISNSSCLSSHTNTWDCASKMDLKLDLSVPQMVSVSPRYPPAANQIRFGPQAPQLSQPVPLRLMADKDGMDKGPAWFFQQPYTKVVVVPGKAWDTDGEGMRHGPKLLRRRRLSSWRINLRDDDAPQAIAPPSAKPWFCYWNNTILEGFIFVTQNFSGVVQPTSPYYNTPSTPTGDFENPAAASSEDYGPESTPVFTSFPPPNSALATASVQKRQPLDPSQLAAYPKDVKIEERRDPNVVLQPYCVHMQIMNDGTASPLADEPIFQLNEDEPGDGQGVLTRGIRREEKRGNLWERDSGTSACECEWLSS
ncbi:MAG: hypothetical protein Q9170_002460 [Blastenia crenularia]